MNDPTNANGYDVVVIGAGSAGLQAALTLGRMRMRAVVLGTDAYRNDPTGEMHNFLGHDGTPPAELRTTGRRDVERYPTVELLDREADSVRGEVGGFVVGLTDGTSLRTARLLLATGVTDTVPDVPGLADLFGGVVAHCPFCHGYEYADGPVGVFAAGPASVHVAAMMDRIASEIVILTHGAELDDETVLALKRAGRDVRTEPVAAVSPGDLGLTVAFADGSTLDLKGMITRTDWRQAAPFAEQLGLEMSAVGAVVVDAMGRTSVPGVYAAGDMAQGPGLPMPMASVLTASAAGLVAAAACVQDTVQA